MSCTVCRAPQKQAEHEAAVAELWRELRDHRDQTLGDLGELRTRLEEEAARAARHGPHRVAHGMATAEEVSLLRDELAAQRLQAAEASRDLAEELNKDLASLRAEIDLLRTQGGAGRSLTPRSHEQAVAVRKEVDKLRRDFTEIRRELDEVLAAHLAASAPAPSPPPRRRQGDARRLGQVEEEEEQEEEDEVLDVEHVRDDFDGLPEHEQEQLLLVMVSHLHSLLVFSPLDALPAILGPRGAPGLLMDCGQSSWPLQCFHPFLALLVSGALVWLCPGWPQEVECEVPEWDACALRRLLQGPFGFVVPLAVLLLIVGMASVLGLVFHVVDSCLRCCACECCWRLLAQLRHRGRGFLYPLFFGWLRPRLPEARFAGPAGLAIACLSYTALAGGVLAAAALGDRAAAGLPVAYTAGEVHCWVLNYLLAPPELVEAGVAAELARCPPGDLWPRLQSTSGRCFGLTASEAAALRRQLWPWWCSQSPGGVPSTPRHVMALYLADAQKLIQWDGLEHGVSASLHESAAGRRRDGYAGLRGDADEGTPNSSKSPRLGNAGIFGQFEGGGSHPSHLQRHSAASGGSEGLQRQACLPDLERVTRPGHGRQPPETGDLLTRREGLGGNPLHGHMGRSLGEGSAREGAESWLRDGHGGNPLHGHGRDGHGHATRSPRELAGDLWLHEGNGGTPLHSHSGRSTAEPWLHEGNGGNPLHGHNSRSTSKAVEPRPHEGSGGRRDDGYAESRTGSRHSRTRRP